MKFSTNLQYPYLKIQSVILLLVVCYLLAFSIIVETLGRQNDLRETTGEFETMGRMINKFYQENSEEKLSSYLESLLINNQVKFIACYNGDFPRQFHSYGEIMNIEKVIGHREIQKKTNFKQVLMSGFIELDNKGQEQGNITGVYLAFERDRKFGLFVPPMSSIYFLSSMSFLLGVGILGLLLRQNIWLPLAKITEFIREMATGEMPPALKAKTPETKNLIVTLNNLREQLMTRQATGGQSEKQLIDEILTTAGSFLGTGKNLDEICSNITETVCKRLEHAVCCSIWLKQPLAGEPANLQLSRRGLYFIHDRFPSEELTPVAEALAKKVTIQGEVEIISDFADHWEFNQWRAAYPFAVMAVPVIAANSVVGSINIWKSRLPYREVISFRMVQLAKILAKLAGIRLENLLLAGKISEELARQENKVKNKCI